MIDKKNIFYCKMTFNRVITHLKSKYSSFFKVSPALRLKFSEKENSTSIGLIKLKSVQKYHTLILKNKHW
jgi:predicted GIY-YIG superfamily endonuclease